MDSHISDKHIHDGHRSRMKAKLAEHGQSVFDTYELLEMLLYLVVPFKDTNPLAKRLLAACGSLDGVLKAPREQLLAVNGVGNRVCDLLSDVNELSEILGSELLPEGAVMSSFDEITEHLLRHYKEKTDYTVAMMTFDNNMNHIATLDVARCDYESSAVVPSLFIEPAIKQQAAVVITAHNHPFGPACPSQGDRATNTLVRSSLDAVGIVHLEHYVISGEYYCSISENKIPALYQTPAVQAYLDGKRGHESGRVEYRPEAVRYNVIDFELFAKIIGYACKNGNPEEVAHKLLTRYLTIENVLCTDISALEELSDRNVAAALKLCAYICSRRVTDLFAFGVRHTEASVADYLKALYIGEPEETVYAILFDREDRVLGCKLISRGTGSGSELLPRKLIQLAVSFGASSVAIAHNHPMGTPTPSREDVNMTANLESILLLSGLGFAYHVVVAGQAAEMVKGSNLRGTDR